MSEEQLSFARISSGRKPRVFSPDCLLFAPLALGNRGHLWVGINPTPRQEVDRFRRRASCPATERKNSPRVGRPEGARLGGGGLEGVKCTPPPLLPASQEDIPSRVLFQPCLSSGPWRVRVGGPHQAGAQTEGRGPGVAWGPAPPGAAGLCNPLLPVAMEGASWWQERDLPPNPQPVLMGNLGLSLAQTTGEMEAQPWGSHCRHPLPPSAVSAVRFLAHCIASLSTS